MRDDLKGIANILLLDIGTALSHANAAERIARDSPKFKQSLVSSLAAAERHAERLLTQIRTAKAEAEAITPTEQEAAK